MATENTARLAVLIDAQSSITEGLLAQSIQPIQQFAYTTGKNATDAAMVIDAMDLLHSGRFDGF